MFPVDLYVKVRRAVMVDNKSERAVTSYFLLSFDAIKALVMPATNSVCSGGLRWRCRI